MVSALRIKCHCCGSPMIEIGYSESRHGKKLNIECVNPACQLQGQTFEAEFYRSRSKESFEAYKRLPRRKYNLE